MRCLLDKVQHATSWKTYHGEIQKRLSNMQRNLEAPYCHVSLPTVERPEFIGI